MEICQSCLTSFEDDATKDVRFTIWEEVNRQWYLCPDCAAKLQDMVLGFMGEQGPADGASHRWAPVTWQQKGTCMDVGHGFKCRGTWRLKGTPSYEESLENLIAKISNYEERTSRLEDV